MPLVETSTFTLPYLVYNAPVNEKTQKLREEFKVDEATGYPEHYAWRSMARLGPKYKYEDPFYKFDPSTPEEHISQKVTLVIGAVVLSAGGHAFLCFSQRRPLYANIWQPLLFGASISAIGLWIQEKTLQRQSKRYGIILDYARKHPERFGEIERPKYRETLQVFVPIR